MRETLHTMSHKEISRLEVIQKVAGKRLTCREAAKQLGLSTRQVARLMKRYRQDGPLGLQSKRRGQTSNRKFTLAFKDKVMTCMRERYRGFGPTFACEKLLEYEQLQISKETLRQWMIEADLWSGKVRQEVVIHPQRCRRPCFGELVQIDGSHHPWFEGRAPACCLLVFIDDATSRLVGLRFEDSETTEGYFNLARRYLKRCGRPVAFYSDKHGVFRVNASEAKSGTGETQFGRAMRELGIEIIYANSSQAKGRVERANGTLQDRLVKEMKLRNIRDRDTANAFLDEFMEDYNARFSVNPMKSTDAHRQTLPNEDELDLIFSWQCERKLSKNLELSYNGTTYQIQGQGKGYRLQHANIKVCDNKRGQVTLLHKGDPLEYTILRKQARMPASEVDSKHINQQVESCRSNARSKGHKPKADHPWRDYKRHQRLITEKKLLNLSAASY